MNTFASRLQYAAEQAKLSQAELCTVTGIPKSAMSQYFSGAFKPKQSRTYLLANALGVDAAWLMGYDVPMIPKKDDSIIHLFDGLTKTPTAVQGDERDEPVTPAMDQHHERSMYGAKLLEELTPEKREEALRYLEFLKSQEMK